MILCIFRFGIFHLVYVKNMFVYEDKQVCPIAC